MMKPNGISVAEARRNFRNVLARAARTGARIRVRRYRTTLAGIVSRSDLERLEQCDELLRRPKKPTRLGPSTQRSAKKR